MRWSPPSHLRNYRLIEETLTELEARLLLGASKEQMKALLPLLPLAAMKTKEGSAVFDAPALIGFAVGWAAALARLDSGPPPGCREIRGGRFVDE